MRERFVRRSNKMLKKTSIICLMFALGLMFSLCGTLAAETIDVDIANFSFSPQTVTINEETWPFSKYIELSSKTIQKVYTE